MRAAIVENTGITHHGQLGVALHEAGILVDIYRPYVDGILPEQGSFDALLVFGGPQNALADAAHPYLPALAALMARAAIAGRAVMGVCLGSQILARGAGAQNLIGTAPEFGWCQIALTDAGRQDPLLAALPAVFPAFEWHSDTFTLPPGAQHLAASNGAQMQAFRFGPKAYGMQFHFEANCAVVADWSRHFAPEIAGFAPDWQAEHPKQAADLGPQADAHGLAVARAWVAMIEGGI